MSLQQSVKRAFQNVKKDITEVKEQIQKLTEKQVQLEASLASLQSQKSHVSDLVQIREGKPSKTKKKK